MKSGVVIVLAAVCICAAALGLWNVWASRETPVEYHKQEWCAAVQRMKEARAVWPPRKRTFWMTWTRWFQKPVSDYEIMQDHEATLFQLGYLTNQNFFVTNRVLTLEFSSNFFYIICRRFGTNKHAIWRLRYEADSHRRGFSAMLPVEHVKEWQSLFREHVARYASNVAPSAVTNHLIE